MNATLLSIEATLLRIEKLLSHKQPREKKTVELTDAEWMQKMQQFYSQFDVPMLLRECEAHYISKGQVFTRTKGVAWLRRQAEWSKPVAMPKAASKFVY